MSKSKKRKARVAPEEVDALAAAPWISLRTGLTVMALLSAILGLYVGWQVAPTLGWQGALLWGAGFAAAIWVVFLLSLLFNAWVRGKKIF